MISGPPAEIADEPTTALDVTNPGAIAAPERQQVQDHGTSLILITHDLAAVSQMAGHHRGAVLRRIVERGPADAVIAIRDNPYTRGLIGSIPHDSAGARAPARRNAG